MDGMILMDKASQARRIINTRSEDLELTTFSSDKWAMKEPVTVNCYFEDKYAGIVGFPRYFIRDHYPKFYNKELLEYRVAPLEAKARFKFNGELWPEQVEPAATAVERLKKFHGGILHGKGGRGKTVTALWIIAEMGMRTLILVDSEMLRDQWRDQIVKFYGISPDDIGSLQADEVNLKNITIGLVQSVAKRDYGKAVNNYFDFVVADEVHEMGAPERSKAVMRLGACYRLGLSATPERKDGLQKLLTWNFGQVIAAIFADTIPVRVVKVQTGLNFSWIKPNAGGQHSLGVLQKLTNKNPSRRRKIAEAIKWCAERRKKVLVLSTEIEHLGILRKLSGVKNFGYLCGKNPDTGKVVTAEEKEKAKTRKVIFGTFSQVKKAIDIPDADTLILATPGGDPRQATYRISRKSEGKEDALVFDLFDRGPVCNMLWNSRNRRYKEEGYQVMTWKELREFMAKKTVPAKPAKKAAVPAKEEKKSTKSKIKETNVKAKKKRPVEEEEDEDDDDDADDSEEESEDDDDGEEEDEDGEDEEEDDAEDDADEDDDDDGDDADDDGDGEGDDDEEGDDEDGDDSEDDEDEDDADDEASEDDAEVEEEDEDDDDEDEEEAPPAKTKGGGKPAKGSAKAAKHEDPPSAKRSGASAKAAGSTTSAHGTISTNCSWKSEAGEKDESGSHDIQVRRFGVPPEELARVGGSLSHTISLGNYESVRIEVTVSLPCYANEHDILVTQDAVEGLVKARLEAQVIATKEKLAKRKAKESKK